MGETKPGLHAAKLAVMEKVRRVEKSRRMQGSGNYQYAGLEEIISELRPAMVTNGLTITPIKSELAQAGVMTLKSGGTMNRTILKVTFRLTHTSGECEDIETFGESADSGDKSCNKCHSAALKYALLETFLLQGAHDDPDDYAPQDQSGSKARREEPSTKAAAATTPAVTPAASSKLADKMLSAIDGAKTLAELAVVKGKANDKRKFLLPDDAKMVRERLQAREQEFLSGSKRGTKQREPGEDG